jgi:hypothetical protein
MKHTIQYIIYCIEPKKQVIGLLGALDTYVVNLLLVGGRTGIEEVIDTKSPVEYYTSILSEQGMTIKSTQYEKLKGIQRVWIEVDFEKTPIHEYTSWNQVDAQDNETLAWKPYWITCLEGSKKEFLGLSVVAKEIPVFGGKHKVTLDDVFTTVLENV